MEEDKRGEWYFVKNKIKERWPLLAEDELDIMQRAPDMVIGKLQEHYEITREEAEREYNYFQKDLHLTQTER